MKYLFYGIVAFTVLTLTNCSSVKNDISNSGAEVKEQSFILVAEKSSLEWNGRWIGGQNDGKSHNGTIAITSGTVVQKGNDYNGGFTVDMNTMICTDIQNEERNASLIEDLESDYFFKTAEFPEAKVHIKSINNESASVTVEVLGIPITQTLPIKVSTEAKVMYLTGSFDFDLKEAKLQELFADPLESDMGGLSSKVQFNLNVELTKK